MSDATAATTAPRRRTLIQSRPMSVEVAIVGAGLCGSLLALALARRGVSVAVVDLHPEHQTDFRCEKISPRQVAMLEQLGVADVLSAAFPWPGGLHTSGFRYEAMVNAVRSAWPKRVKFIAGRVLDIPVDSIGDGVGRKIVGVDGDLVRARLAVVASGASPALVAKLGLYRESVRDSHSICIGFSLLTAEGRPLPFNDLIHLGERVGDRVGYASFFPMDGATRVNLFTYHDPSDPWVRAARKAPLEGLLQVAPGLRGLLADAREVGTADIRVTHLHRLIWPERPALVVLGDAYQTSCPSTAFGVTRLVSDIQALVDRVGVWLAAPAIGVAEISNFYGDARKNAVDHESADAAERARSTAVETSPYWRLRRMARDVKRGLRPRPMAAAAPVQPVRGDQVRVKSAVEVLASLDSDGRIAGLPFMPEMIPFLGRTLAVRRRADQTCVEGLGLRALPQTVFLDGARCDGAAHDGCQRGCALLWKEAWLAPAETPAPAIDPDAEVEARHRLAALATRDGELYLCQSTALAAATGPAPGVSVLAQDLKRGELGLGRLAEILARSVARKALAMLGRGEIGSLKGQDGKTQVRLDLTPGEKVRIKPAASIAKTLNSRGRNRGMTFEPEMTGHAGRVYTVAGPIERMIHEETGRMVRLQSTVTLEGVDCQGRCTRNCPRANPLFWREAWLERVEA